MIIKYNQDLKVKTNNIQDKYLEREMLQNKLRADYNKKFKIILKLLNIHQEKLIKYICKLSNEF